MSNEKENPRRNAPCFERLCQRFDDIFRHQAQKGELRNYLCGLLGEIEQKNLLQMVAHTIGVIYLKLYTFLKSAPWSFSQMNQRRLEVMNQCHHTRISRGFSSIVDD